MKKGALATITTLLGAATGAASVYGTMNKKMQDEMRQEKELNKKNDAILKLYNKWFGLRQDGKSIADYCKANGYHSIAVYGMHYLGESLCKELKDSDIKIEYAVDRNPNQGMDSEIKIYTPEEELKEVDAVIVTAFFFFDEIEADLCLKMDCPIISLEDIINEL